MKKTLALFIVGLYLVLPLQAEATPATPSLLVDESSTATLGAYTTASFSVTAGDLIIVAADIGAPSGAGTFDPVTDSFSNVGTWTEHVDYNGQNGGTFSTLISTAIAGSSESGTITVDPLVSSTRWNVKVYVVTGGTYNASVPVAQSAQASTTASTLTATLGSTPATDSLVFASLTSRDGGLPIATPGANFTELDESFANPAGAQDQYDADNATTACDWSVLTTQMNVGGCIEISATPAGGGGGFIGGSVID